jgi:histidine triad (HIT) family protein
MAPDRQRPAGCAFCAIASGGAPAHTVLEDDDFVAFLDLRAVFPGHVLVVPRVHHETLLDLPPEDVGPLFLRARTIAAAVEGGLGAGGSFVAVNNRVSQSVPHLHVHVVPRTRGDGLRGFFWPRTKYGSEEEMADVAARLRAAVAAVGAADGRR